MLRVDMKDSSIGIVNQTIEAITCQCQYMVTDKRTGEKVELTLRFVVPDTLEWYEVAERIIDNLGYSINHTVGTWFLHKTWVDASELYMQGEQTFR